MPILKENKKQYPKNWKEISYDIRVTRAKQRCEICGVFNYSYINKKTREICLQDDFDAIRVILTVTHLNHTPEDCRPENLKALCQKCHNKYDAQHRAETRKKKKLQNQLKIQFI
jgi:hypothetical protein